MSRIAALPKIVNLGRRWLRNLMAGLIGPFKLLVEHHNLLRVLIKRDIFNQTSGTVLGSFWVLAQPALQVLAFWFLFDFVLKVRMPGRVPFLEYFLMGMLPWFLISSVIQRNLMVLTEFSALYQRSVFPIRLLPLVPMLMAGLTYGVILPILAGFMIGWPAAVLALFIVVGLMIWLLPICYLVAILGLFVRDARQVIPFLLMMTLFLTPILYMPQQLGAIQPWLVLNPFADLMAVIHGVLQGMPVTVGNFVRPLALWLILLAPAWALFRRTEPHMREEL
jgi:lipopolysaccharide transport system permease protein